MRHLLSIVGLVVPVGAVSVLVACGDKSGDEDSAAVNAAPVAVAGPDATATSDTPISLDGRGSFDPEGKRVKYHWAFDTVPPGSAVAVDALSANGSADAGLVSFTADRAGTYVVRLEVEDDAQRSAPDLVVITVESGAVPVASAGPDLSGVEGDTFSLNGGGSTDPFGRSLSYRWSFQQVPTGSAVAGLSGSDSANASFTADLGGLYIATLVVNNGISDSAPDTALVRVSSRNPLPPVADAGADLDIEDCTNAPLSGLASFDPNGEALSYRWAVQVKPAGSSVTDAAFSNRDAAEPTFQADVAGDYVVSLAVSDGTAWSVPDLLTLHVAERARNSPPSVSAGAPKTAAAGDAECSPSGYSYACDSCESLVLALGDDATVSDADGDTLRYSWDVITGNGEIADPTALSTTVRLEDAEATTPGTCDNNTFVMRLTATDCTGASTTSDVTYTVTCCGITATTAR
jgi:hypothetical protein